MTYSCSSWDVLSEYYALDLDDEEVDEMLGIVKSGFEGLLGELVVSAWTDSASNTGAHNSLGCNFREGDDCNASDMSILCVMLVPPRVIQLILRSHLTTGRYRQAKMKRMDAAKVMPVARGFSQLRSE